MKALFILFFVAVLSLNAEDITIQVMNTNDTSEFASSISAYNVLEFEVENMSSSTLSIDEATLGFSGMRASEIKAVNTSGNFCEWKVLNDSMITINIENMQIEPGQKKQEFISLYLGSIDYRECRIYISQEEDLKYSFMGQTQIVHAQFPMISSFQRLYGYIADLHFIGQDIIVDSLGSYNITGQGRIGAEYIHDDGLFVSQLRLYYSGDNDIELHVFIDEKKVANTKVVHGYFDVQLETVIIGLDNIDFRMEIMVNGVSSFGFDTLEIVSAQSQTTHWSAWTETRLANSIIEFREPSFVTELDENVAEIFITNDQLICRSNNILSGSLMIYDQLGRLHGSVRVSSGSTFMDLDRLNSGIYFAVLETDNGRMIKKIIK